MSMTCHLPCLAQFIGYSPCTYIVRRIYPYRAVRLSLKVVICALLQITIAYAVRSVHSLERTETFHSPHLARLPSPFAPSHLLFVLLSQTGHLRFLQSASVVQFARPFVCFSWNTTSSIRSTSSLLLSRMTPGPAPCLCSGYGLRKCESVVERMTLSSLPAGTALTSALTRSLLQTATDIEDLSVDSPVVRAESRVPDLQTEDISTKTHKSPPPPSDVPTRSNQICTDPPFLSASSTPNP